MARDRQQHYDDSWDYRTADNDRGRNGKPPRGSASVVTPLRIVVVVALVGSLAYLAYALTVRDASQIPMLASGAAVLGVVFVGLAFAGALATYRAGADGRSGTAFRNAILGGVAAMIAAGCFAGAVVLALVWQAG
jgi:hypothetical protein